MSSGGPTLPHWGRGTARQGLASGTSIPSNRPRPTLRPPRPHPPPLMLPLVSAALGAALGAAGALGLARRRRECGEDGMAADADG